MIYISIIFLLYISKYFNLLRDSIYNIIRIFKHSGRPKKHKTKPKEIKVVSKAFAGFYSIKLDVKYKEIKELLNTNEKKLLFDCVKTNKSYFKKTKILTDEVHDDSYLLNHTTGFKFLNDINIYGLEKKPTTYSINKQNKEMELAHRKEVFPYVPEVNNNTPIDFTVGGENLKLDFILTQVIKLNS